jgi:hypothetical protein
MMPDVPTEDEAREIVEKIDIEGRDPVHPEGYKTADAKMRKVSIPKPKTSPHRITEEEKALLDRNRERKASVTAEARISTWDQYLRENVTGGNSTILYHHKYGEPPEWWDPTAPDQGRSNQPKK